MHHSNGATVFEVVVRPHHRPQFEARGQDASGLTEDSSNYTGRLQFVGVHHHDEPVSFTVPLSDTLKALAARNMLKPNEPLQIVVIPESKPTLAPNVAQENFKSSLANVSIGTS